jgi:hypothetical protein
MSERITLDWQKFGVQEAISQEALTQMPRGVHSELSWFKDILMDNLIVRMKSMILGQHVRNGREEVSMNVPKTWLDAFLEQTWIGKQISRWRPPRYRTIKTEVIWDRFVLLPDWANKIPPSFGTPVVIELHRTEPWKEL